MFFHFFSLLASSKKKKKLFSFYCVSLFLPFHLLFSLSSWSSFFFFFLSLFSEFSSFPSLYPAFLYRSVLSFSNDSSCHSIKLSQISLESVISLDWLGFNHRLDKRPAFIETKAINLIIPLAEVSLSVIDCFNCLLEMGEFYMTFTLKTYL